MRPPRTAGLTDLAAALDQLPVGKEASADILGARVADEPDQVTGLDAPGTTVREMREAGERHRQITVGRSIDPATDPENCGPPRPARASSPPVDLQVAKESFEPDTDDPLFARGYRIGRIKGLLELLPEDEQFSTLCHTDDIENVQRLGDAYGRAVTAEFPGMPDTREPGCYSLGELEFSGRVLEPHQMAVTFHSVENTLYLDEDDDA